MPPAGGGGGAADAQGAAKRRRRWCEEKDGTPGIGISLSGLETLYRTTDGRCTRQMWRDVWMNDIQPDGWTAERIFGPPSGPDDPMTFQGPSDNMVWLRDIFTNTATGQQLTKTPENMHEFLFPPGSKASLLDTSTNRALDFSGASDTATHYMSYGWNIPCHDVAEAAKLALQHETQDCYVWLDLLHMDRWMSRPTDGLYAGAQLMQGLDLLQVCSKWDEPERLKRAWIMHEAFHAVVSGARIIVAMSQSEHTRMATALRERGPPAILDVVFGMAADPNTVEMSGTQSQRGKLVAELKNMQAAVGGREQMDLKLAEATRRAYASAIEIEWERQWIQHGPTSPDVLDLGHQLAALWALTEEQGKAQRTFERVLAAVRELPEDWNAAKVARRDRTAGALVQLLLSQGSEEQTAAAHAVEKAAFAGELAVSFQGVSVAFLAAFVEEHDAELNFLSTDAVVERVIKLESKRASVVGPTRQGRAFIETLHEQWKGTPTFFLSHAWRQTFHVSGCQWRGGAVQAMIQSARCPACKDDPETAVLPLPCAACAAVRARTFVWFDIFCVNQHLVSPHGGLQAFAFDPLHNAIRSAERVEMFLETWDDPATLSRVWCLEELRVAMMLGKDVRIAMPKQAMDSFRKQAEDDGLATIQGIDKAIDRISIEHASATFDRDRRLVFEAIDASVGRQAVDWFAKEIMREALLAAAFPSGLPPELMAADNDRTAQWDAIFAEILEIADKAETSTAQEIQIRRAVALMRLREHRKQGGGGAVARRTSADGLGLRELDCAAALALRYYGPRSAEVLDFSQHSTPLDQTIQWRDEDYPMET